MTGYAISRCIAPAASLGLVGLDQVKDELGIAADDSSNDAMLGQHIAQVSAAINTYCDRIFVRQSYRDQFRSTFESGLCSGTPLILRQRPIAVEAGLPVVVIIEGTTTLTASQWETDERLGRLYRFDSAGNIGAWGGSPVIVDYDAGYDVIPADIQAAALRCVTARYSVRGRDPMLRSQTIPDVVSESYFSAGAGSGSLSTAMPAEAMEILDAYALRYM